MSDTPPPVTLAQMVDAVRNAADAVSVSGTTRWENAPEVACKFWNSEIALRAAAATIEGMGWRDIASAPENVEVLLLDPDGRMRVACSVHGWRIGWQRHADAAELHALVGHRGSDSWMLAGWIQARSRKSGRSGIGTVSPARL